MKLLITGGCGFLGSNLAAYAIKNNYELTIFDNLSRFGSSKNLEWLRTLGKFTFIHGDIRNLSDVESLIKQQFDGVFHLSGQVAMTTSIENPYNDFLVNSLGTLNILDSIRKYSKNTIIIYSSTNKVYGDLEYFDYTEGKTRFSCVQFPNGFNEDVPLDFRSPYGCSKGCADQYMLDYYRIFNVNTTVFRHSSMYGSRQFATYDQGWVGWFCQKAVDFLNNPDEKPFTISGTGKQVRDILNSEDMVRLYFTALDNSKKVAGNAYNIGGSMEQSLSLIELFEMINEILGIDLKYTRNPARSCDQKVFVADITKITKAIGWKPLVSARCGVADMLNWINEAK